MLCLYWEVKALWCWSKHHLQQQISIVDDELIPKLCTTLNMKTSWSIACMFLQPLRCIPMYGIHVAMLRHEGCPIILHIPLHKPLITYFKRSIESHPNTQEHTTMSFEYAPLNSPQMTPCLKNNANTGNFTNDIHIQAHSPPTPLWP